MDELNWKEQDLVRKARALASAKSAYEAAVQGKVDATSRLKQAYDAWEVACTDWLSATEDMRLATC